MIELWTIYPPSPVYKHLSYVTKYTQMSKVGRKFTRKLKRAVREKSLKNCVHFVPDALFEKVGKWNILKFNYEIFRMIRRQVAYFVATPRQVTNVQYSIEYGTV